MSNVVLENLTKRYPQKGRADALAVDRIDLAIEEGEFMVLVGPSGCGKSTTLRMIAGLEAISGGTVAIDGRVVNDVLPKDRDIAMVFQNYALYPHMSVWENMAFGLKLRKLPRAEIDRRVREASVMLGLEGLLERKPKALSGGQRQRVAVGRAIVRKPRVFLFDEPLSNLDAKMRVSTRTEIARLHARLGATMIYVTHDQIEAMTMGDRICVMKDGRIQQVAAPLEVYHQPANLFVAGFIGSPPMNLFRGTIFRDGEDMVFVETSESDTPARISLPRGMVADAALEPGRAIVLGIRPENVALGPVAFGPPSNFEADVELVEPMGAETMVHLTTGATHFIARLSAAARPKRGERTSVQLDFDRMHLFDAASERRLS